MRPDFPDMTEPTYILFDGKARVGRSKLHRVPVEDFFNSLLGLVLRLRLGLLLLHRLLLHRDVHHRWWYRWSAV